MRLGLINSAWVQANQPTVYGLQKTKELGFDTVDIFVDPLDIDIKERRLIKRECDRLKLPIVSIACVAVGLIDFNPSVQRFSIDRVKKYLELAYEYQAKNVLLVLGEYIWNQEVIPPAEQWKTGVENCRVLGDYAANLGVKLALELEPFHLSLVNSVDTMVRFLDDCNHEAVRANIDISHLCLAKVPDEELRRLKGKAIHVHSSECDGKRHGDLPADAAGWAALVGCVGTSRCPLPLIRVLQPGNVQLLHSHHRLHGPLGFRGSVVGDEREEDAGDDLPGEAILVLQPAALLGVFVTPR